MVVNVDSREEYLVEELPIHLTLEYKERTSALDVEYSRKSGACVTVDKGGTSRTRISISGYPAVIQLIGNTRTYGVGHIVATPGA